MMPVAAGNAEWKAATEWHVTVFLNHGAGPDNVYKALSGELRWSDPVGLPVVVGVDDAGIGLTGIGAPTPPEPGRGVSASPGLPTGIGG